jgi:transposase
LLDRLRSAPAGRAGELESLTRRAIVRGLVDALQAIVAQIAELERRIADALQAHPDGEIFRSFLCRRESVICPATLLAEIGDCRARYPHRDAIAADGGQAPVAAHRQAQRRRVSLGMQQAAAQRTRHPGPERLALEPVGG